MSLKAHTSLVTLLLSSLSSLKSTSAWPPSLASSSPNPPQKYLIILYAAVRHATCLAYLSDNHRNAERYMLNNTHNPPSTTFPLRSSNIHPRTPSCTTTVTSHHITHTHTHTHTHSKFGNVAPLLSSDDKQVVTLQKHTLVTLTQCKILPCPTCGFKIDHQRFMACEFYDRYRSILVRRVNSQNSSRQCAATWPAPSSIRG